MTRRDFWQSAGAHLLQPNADGWLEVTEDFLRAYYARPELRPIETSCDREIRLFEDLMETPFAPIDEARLAQLADPDAADNYRTILAYRERLLEAGTVEGAYQSLVAKPDPRIPQIFLDQLVHVIIWNVLQSTDNPMRLRAGEIFFRKQTVSLEGGRLMLADDESVAMHAANKDHGVGLVQLLKETGVAVKEVQLDVLDEDNKEMYWSRSDRFDTVVDFRFEQPALDAFARVLEAWLWHLMRLEVNVQPLPRIDDHDWRWHIGLDVEATRILNALYNGEALADEDLRQIAALFRMQIKDKSAVIERVRAMPVYLGLAMTRDNKITMKPHNLLTNLPLGRRA